MLTFTDYDKITVTRSRDKTAYYISAGFLGALGIALEISGICDHRKATQVYTTRNGIGIRKRF